jgi:hypothetical protein
MPWEEEYKKSRLSSISAAISGQENVRTQAAASSIPAAFHQRAGRFCRCDHLLGDTKAPEALRAISRIIVQSCIPGIPFSLYPGTGIPPTQSPILGRFRRWREVPIFDLCVAASISASIRLSCRCPGYQHSRIFFVEKSASGGYRLTLPGTDFSLKGQPGVGDHPEHDRCRARIHQE